MGDQPVPLPPPPTAGAPIDAPEGIDSDRSHERRLWVIPVIVVASMILVGVAIAVLSQDGSTLSMPDTLGGHRRVTGEVIDELVEDLEREFAQAPTEPILGVYGTLAEPRFMVIAFPGEPPPGDPFDAMGPDVSGLGATASIDLDSVTTATEGDVTYSCAPYTMSSTFGADVSADFCIWTEPDSYGLVMTLDPSLDASGLTREAHDGVVNEAD